MTSLSAGTLDVSRMPRLGGIPLSLLFASLICLIGSVPAACVNAYILSRAANNEMDAPWFSALSGGLIGALVAMLMGAPGLNALGALFAITGALMGLLHWLIAIRPRRLWRLHMLRDEAAIRAME
jgi:ABC-type branched-subunit amino acid transport system permease subunit